MKLIPTLSTHLFALATLDRDVLAAAAQAGFRSIEIFAAPQHFPIHDRDRALRLLSMVDESGMKTAAIHAPFYMSLEKLIAGEAFALGDRTDDRRAQALASTRAVLSLASACGSPPVVVHMGHLDAATADAVLFIDSVNALLRDVNGYAGSLLLENTPHVAESFDELDRVGRATPADRVGFCIDLGHLHIHSGGEGPCGMNTDDEHRTALNERILRRTRHFHVHDNDGSKDAHLPPGEGTIDWEAVLGRLDSVPGKATFSLELRDTSRGRRRPGEYLASVLDRISGPVKELFFEGGIRP